MTLPIEVDAQRQQQDASRPSGVVARTLGIGALGTTVGFANSSFVAVSFSAPSPDPGKPPPILERAPGFPHPPQEPLTVRITGPVRVLKRIAEDWALSQDELASLLA